MSDLHRSVLSTVELAQGLEHLDELVAKAELERDLLRVDPAGHEGTSSCSTFLDLRPGLMPSGKSEHRGMLKGSVVYHPRSFSTRQVGQAFLDDGQIPNDGANS